MLTEKDKTTIREISKKYSAKRVLLFGSGIDPKIESSDIDIAVIMNTIDDYLETSKKINKLTRGIDTRIEPVLLQSNEDSSGFLSTVLNTGITLYSN